MLGTLVEIFNLFKLNLIHAPLKSVSVPSKSGKNILSQNWFRTYATIFVTR